MQLQMNSIWEDILTMKNVTMLTKNSSSRIPVRKRGAAPALSPHSLPGNTTRDNKGPTQQRRSHSQSSHCKSKCDLLRSEWTLLYFKCLKYSFNHTHCHSSAAIQTGVCQGREQASPTSSLTKDISNKRWKIDSINLLIRNLSYSQAGYCVFPLTAVFLNKIL